MTNSQPPTDCQRERLVKVFEFLKAYNELRYPPVRDINEQLRVFWLKDLPKHSSVELSDGNSNPEAESERTTVVLRITRPRLSPSPVPPAGIADWIKPGWEKIDSAIEVHTSRNVPDRRGNLRLEQFADLPERSATLEKWRGQREVWQSTEGPARQSMALFQSVYEWFGIQEREPERVEILLGEGLLNYPNEVGNFNHPVLLQKLELEFYPEKGNPQFVFRKREQPPELYVEFLRLLPEVNHRQIAACVDELRETELSPLGGGDTEGFLRRLIQGVLPAAGRFVSSPYLEKGQPSARDAGRHEVSVTDNRVPVRITRKDDWYELDNPGAARITGPISASNLESSLRRLREHGWEPVIQYDTGPVIRRDPVIYMRQRHSGAARVFDLVLEDIVNRIDFPSALLQIVGLPGTVSNTLPENPGPLQFGNEDEDILLSKPANKEQLEIARQLARRDCVLVQGPPGTGKTHTIANLLGHLLANGKSVLVTAHTPKALRVLRQKVVEPLQPLCISVLQNDKQSQDELQQSVTKIHVGLSQDEVMLEREATHLKKERNRLIQQLRDIRSRLLDARQDETRAIVFGGNEVRPIDAAKRVKAGIGSTDWIPSPVNLGELLPISHAEVADLYQTNARVSSEDERELNATRPDIATLPTPRQFHDLVEEMKVLTANDNDLRYRADLWEGAPTPVSVPQFDSMLELAINAIDFLRDRAPWQVEAVQAGRDGDEAKWVWLSLNELIECTWKEVQDSHALVMAHGPQVGDQRSAHELLPIVDEIIEHIEAGRSFGLLTKITKRACHDVLSTIKIGNRRPAVSDTTHLRAVRALLRIQLVRQELVERWDRQITAKGGPAPRELTDKPEQVCRQFIPKIQACLEWHSSIWLPLEAEFQRMGFSWSTYLESTPPETGENAELRRLRNAVVGDLERILRARAGWLRLQHLQRVWRDWCALVPESGVDGALAYKIRQAVREAAPARYQQGYEELVRLKNLEPELANRRNLLARLERSAPAWASAIQNRLPLHARPELPGDPTVAWEWRQLRDELERRANVPIDELQRRIEHLSRELLDVTSQLVEKLTWVNLIRKTKPTQKQALGAYAAMRNKLTKSGKGVQDAEMRAGARRAMAEAKDAVPVWIMPLSEVTEAFDPRYTRFEVVIIDEASQCDPTAMFALYLGRQAIIVGDDEQVTPVAVGVEMSNVQKLREVHLQGIPAKELYDGETSIYEFAQIAFGGVIRLVEHFRCAPNIIAFSNTLSYRGEIKPLREPSSVRLARHVLPYRLEGDRGRNDEVNEPEAEAIASLICAAVEQPEYSVNQDEEPMSFGVVSLVGAQQAMRVDALLRQRLEPAEYKRRRILCGQAAQFQGDERDVMFLSLVDSSPPEPPLPMRQEGPKKIFKRRFNVAASRARDQMWVVHTLNHEIDLKPGDYRRLLIEHAIDPLAWEREFERRLAQVDPASREFEGRVLRRLLGASYHVVPQYKVGGYRIDLVVVGGGKRLAVECDGERYHGPERLAEDLERQAILERLGWQFVRIRGSIFFRDEDRAMRPVFQRLQELDITPESEKIIDNAGVAGDVLTERVIRRAEELRSEWRDARVRVATATNMLH